MLRSSSASAGSALFRLRLETSTDQVPVATEQPAQASQAVRFLFADLRGGASASLQNSRGHRAPVVVLAKAEALVSDNLKAVTVQGDGRCMFRALVSSLSCSWLCSVSCAWTELTCERNLLQGSRTDSGKLGVLTPGSLLTETEHF